MPAGRGLCLLWVFAAGVACTDGPRLAAAAPTETFAQGLKCRAAQQAVGVLLDNQLPLKLDANTTFPAVAVLPGKVFQPLALKLTPAAMDEPLPPATT